MRLRTLRARNVRLFSLDDRTWGTGGAREYAESVESVVRNVIQQQKIEMADEIINAGRFDQRTTHAERRDTLEKLMQAQAGGGRALVRGAEHARAEPADRADARGNRAVRRHGRGFHAVARAAGHGVRDAAVHRLRRRRSRRSRRELRQAQAGAAGDAAEAKKAADAQALSGVVLGRGERSRGGYVPGAYRAADAALTGADAGCRVARRAAAAADAKSAAAGEKDAARNAATTVPGESAGPLVDAAALDLEVIEAEDSEVTQDDDVLGGDDAGVVTPTRRRRRRRRRTKRAN